MDYHRRSWAKAISYRLLGSLVTGAIALVATQRWDMSLGIASADLVLKAALYYFHERAWNKIRWGRK